ncbi:hypothetical protein GW17_00036959 [Ensete ventricosum]|nr:hypothetical protein GW17_00036959 [Ensete ventricosum]RZS14980.1 hypothetical protein BHM03_00046747 [Ensete ventricosum]
MSSGASDPTLGGCVSTSPTLGMQWSPGPSSSSWAYLSSTPPTLSFPVSSPAMPTTWWSNSPSPLPPAYPTSVSLPSFAVTTSVASSSSIRWTLTLF